MWKTFLNKPFSDPPALAALVTPQKIGVLALLILGLPFVLVGQATGSPADVKQQILGPSTEFRYVYFVECSGTLTKVDIATHQVVTTLRLAGRTGKKAPIPTTHVDGCSTENALYEVHTGRMFVVVPKEPSGERRHYQVLAFTLPEVTLLNVIDIEPFLIRAPGIVVSPDGSRLFVSEVEKEGESAEKSGSAIAVYDIRTPTSAKLVVRQPADYSFGAHAYFGNEGSKIYSGDEMITLRGDIGSAAIVDVNKLLVAPVGVPLQPYKYIDPDTKRSKALGYYADSAGGRLLERIQAEPKFGTVFAAIDMPSSKITVVSGAPAASASNLHLSQDGRQVLLEEVTAADRSRHTDKTGRLVLYDAETGGQLRDRKFMEIAGSEALLRCVSPDSVYIYTKAESLLFVTFSQDRAAGMPLGARLDPNTSCLFADR
jgi:hypothetical protein